VCFTLVLAGRGALGQIGAWLWVDLGLKQSETPLSVPAFSCPSGWLCCGTCTSISSEPSRGMAPAEKSPGKKGAGKLSVANGHTTHRLLCQCHGRAW